MKRRHIAASILIFLLAIPCVVYLLLPRIIAPLIQQNLSKFGCLNTQLKLTRSTKDSTQIAELHCELPETAVIHLKNIEINYSLGKIYRGQIGSLSVESAEIEWLAKKEQKQSEFEIPAFYYFIPVSKVKILQLKVSYPWEKEKAEIKAKIDLECGPTSISGHIESAASAPGSSLEFHSQFALHANEARFQIEKFWAKQKEHKVTFAPNSELHITKDGEKYKLENSKEISIQTTQQKQNFQLAVREIELDYGDTLLSRFLFRIDSALPEVLVRLDFDPKNRRLILASDSAKVQLAQAWPFLMGLAKMKNPPLKISNGLAELTLQATVNFQKTAFLEKVLVLGKLLQVSGEFNGLSFDQLNYPLRLSFEKESMTLEKGPLEIASLKSGVTVMNLRGILGAQKMDLLSGYDIEIPSVQMELFSGLLKAENIFYNSERPKAKFQLDFVALNLQELIAFQKQDNISGTGLLDGTLPVEILRNELVIKDGIVRARAPGGRISYFADESLSSVASANAGFKLAIEALRNFQYQVLEGKMNFSALGNMDLALRLEGNNPEWNKGRPVHFNLTISENVLDLLKSMRMAEDLSGALENKMRKKVK